MDMKPFGADGYVARGPLTSREVYRRHDSTIPRGGGRIERQGRAEALESVLFRASNICLSPEMATLTFTGRAASVSKRSARIDARSSTASSRRPPRTHRPKDFVPSPVAHRTATPSATCSCSRRRGLRALHALHVAKALSSILLRSALYAAPREGGALASRRRSTTSGPTRDDMPDAEAAPHAKRMITSMFPPGGSIPLASAEDRGDARPRPSHPLPHG